MIFRLGAQLAFTFFLVGTATMLAFRPSNAVLRRLLNAPGVRTSSFSVNALTPRKRLGAPSRVVAHGDEANDYDNAAGEGLGARAGSGGVQFSSALRTPSPSGLTSSTVGEEEEVSAAIIPVLSVEEFRKLHQITIRGEGASPSTFPPMMDFSMTPFAGSLQRVLTGAGYTSPTSIQAQSWPIAMANRGEIIKR